MTIEFEPIIACHACGKKYFVSAHTINGNSSRSGISKCPYCGRENEPQKKKLTEKMRQQEPTIYYLVTYDHFVNGDSLAHASWCTRDEAFGGLVWKNFVGGMCPCQDGDRVHEVTMADDIMDLDWTKTYMYQGLEEDFFTGWLSPKGEFVQSARGKLNDTAEFIIGKEPEYLKSHGWLRLEKLDRAPYFTPRNLLTKQQYHWLEAHGYKTYGMEDIE